MRCWENFLQAKLTIDFIVHFVIQKPYLISALFTLIYLAPVYIWTVKIIGKSSSRQVMSCYSIYHKINSFLVKPRIVYILKQITKTTEVQI